MSDWAARMAVREDEPCIIQMWMHQLLRHSYAQVDVPQALRKPRPVAGSDEHIAFWRAAQPVIEGLLRSRNVRTVVVCDAERSEYLPGRPAVVCGWAMSDSARIYGVGLKRHYLPNPAGSLSENAVLRDIGAELARTVLGDLIGQERRSVMPLYDLHRLGLPTPLWSRDESWLDMMADVSRVVANDAVSADVSRHVLDPFRVPWAPNEQRKSEAA